MRTGDVFLRDCVPTWSCAHVVRACGWSRLCRGHSLIPDLELVTKFSWPSFSSFLKWRDWPGWEVFEVCVCVFSCRTLSSNKGSSGSPGNETEKLKFLSGSQVEPRVDPSPLVPYQSPRSLMVLCRSLKTTALGDLKAPPASRLPVCARVLKGWSTRRPGRGICLLKTICLDPTD